jgi:hypothetical protein
VKTPAGVVSRFGRSVLPVTAMLVLVMALGTPPTARATGAVVTNLNDSGPGSLRAAIAAATAGDHITFGVTGTINLSTGALVVNKDLTITGPGALSLVISGNLVTPALASRVFNNSATLTISGVTIRSGTAGVGSGGGVLNTGDLTIADSVVADNRAQTGGGVYNSGTLHVTNSTFSANLTSLFDAGLDASGAGIYNAGTATISDTTFFDNLVHDNGSAFLNGPGATATITSSTFSFNQMNGIAAVYADKNSTLLTLNNVTITGNVGSKKATGLYSAGGAVDLANSIVAGNNTQGNTALPDCAGTLTSGGHNLIGNATGCALSAGTGDQLGSDVAPIDAKLGPLARNGGPTSTHTLLPGSPAIDAGNPAAPGSGSGACDTTDQRGVARPAQGFSSMTCDIGAVEIGVTTDAVAPTAGGAPVQRFVTGAGSGIPVRLTWTAGSDTGGSGLAGYILQRKIDTGAFATIAHPASTSASVVLRAGHTYRFRVAAIDGAGNTSGFLAGPAFRAVLDQESNTAIHYSRGWVLASSSAYEGGHARYTTASLASATFTFTGRNVAWVTLRNASQGRAKVYVDGHLVTTVNLFSAVSMPRQIVFTRTWSSSGSHTVRIVGLATAGHPRVTVDAFLVLR